MKILTDTHTLVWALSNPEALGRATHEALARDPFMASVANLWELVLKASKPGSLVADPLPWWEKYVVRSGIRVMSIRTPHIQTLAHLPDVHKDPFDRILVAQALAEEMTLASKDAILMRYGVPLIWD